MANISEKTFEPEGRSFIGIDGIFWGTAADYPVDPFAGILDDLELNPYPEELDTYFPENPRWQRLGHGGLVYTDRENALRQIDLAGKSEGEFTEAFWNSLGIDIEYELEKRQSSNRGQKGSRQDLMAKFGPDALGTYCPWHAFGRSKRTPWGIYIFLEKLMDQACLLHQRNEFLPDPKPSLLKVFQFVYLSTYRHEQFHFHVEMYATRFESALRRPIYRPYVERVRMPVVNTVEWWEEALAQAVVLDSTFVKRTLGIDVAYMKNYVVPYFRQFPEGYKRFECKSVPGGVAGAHRLLSAQIARTSIDIPESERNTDLSLAKSEYRTRRLAVPGYVVGRPEFLSRFQLQTPRFKDVERFIRRHGTIDENAPGDHKRATLNGQRFHLNRAKRGNTLDLASAKELARVLGMKMDDLNHAIV